MSFFQRLRDVLGIDEYEEYEDDLEDPEQALDEPEEGSFERRLRSGSGPSPSGSSHNGSSKVIGLPGAGQMEVVMMQPRSFQEMPQAVNALRERKSVILDLTLMDAQQAQRSADYVAGGAYAIDGHQRHLGACVFLFTPSFVQISSYSSTDSSTHAEAEPAAQPSTTASPIGIPPILSRTSLNRTSLNRTSSKTSFGTEF